MRDYNLHTHTVYCGHGADLPHDYAEKALEAGLKVLGFSEHLPFPDGRLARSRMAYGTKPEYLADIAETKADYAPKGLEIILGWECDYFPDMKSYYEELKTETDYLTFGCHFLKYGDEYGSMFKQGLGHKEIGLYADNIIEGISTGYFEFVAHPDLFFFGYEPWDDESKAISRAIIEAAMANGVALEVNGNGLIRSTPYDRPVYPMPKFWELAAEMNAELVVGNTDAHRAEHVAYSLPRIDEFIKPYGIELSELGSVHPLKFRKAR